MRSFPARVLPGLGGKGELTQDSACQLGNASAQGGFFSQTSVVLYCACSLIALAALGFSMEAMARLRRLSPEPREMRRDCQDILAQGLARLNQGTDPGFDAPQDNRFQGLKNGPTCLEIRELSSHLDPNWVSIEFLEESALKAWLSQGDGKGLRAWRIAHGPSQNPEDFSPFFNRISDFGQLECSSYPNLNAMDQSAMESLASRLLGDQASAAGFSREVLARIQARGPMDKDGLGSILRGPWRAMEAYLAVEAQVNVNFAPSALILAVLSYPAFGYSRPVEALRAIEARRASRAIDPDYLGDILGPGANPGLASYLGCQSWFFELRASQGRYSLVARVARLLPRPINQGKAPFRVVSLREGYEAHY